MEICRYALHATTADPRRSDVTRRQWKKGDAHDVGESLCFAAMVRSLVFGYSEADSDTMDCLTDVRDPIGRPKKRKTEDQAGSQSPIDHNAQRMRRSISDSSTRMMATQLPSRGIDRCCSQRHSSSQESSSALDTLSISTGMASPGQSSSTSLNTAFAPTEEQQPTLSDLGLAAFLQSLDTLEINNEDGLTPNMLQALQGGTSFSSAALQAQTGQGPTSVPSLYPTTTQLSLGSLLEMQSGTSYAVPADLSWADPSWLQSGVSTFAPMPPEAISSPQMVKSEGPCAKTGEASCCCSGSSQDEATPRATQAIASTEQQRVHCVPNPNGKGCTCLCDVSVALINVRATLRQAKEHAQDDDSTLHLANRVIGSTKGAAASTLHLTLSASQAVADQCACSASCPTCRSDPNTSLSASLLISSALQIYIRAVRTLRQGFGANHDGVTPNPGNEWDVSIGQYRPKPHNAKRISLFAMKLELRDLRDAIAKISNAASASLIEANWSQASEVVAPIDSIVIRKLHHQITQLLSTVEGIEQQQDAERERVYVF